jgi:DNA-binding NarL/FixJ family response regulator
MSTRRASPISCGPTRSRTPLPVVADDSAPTIVGIALRVALVDTISVQARWLRDNGSPTKPDRRHRITDLNLTPRQFDVLRLLALGRANKCIAEELGLGVRTVKGHVAVILRALHADNRRDARRNDGASVLLSGGTGPRQGRNGIR